ncbi:hypothetical protein FQN54_008956 [Arachnomyces sp. PD_36]|nr:hypothetical protein FQN54_008956 [Arachnomyces sp. PD_36]
MKFNIALLFAATQVAGVFSAALPAENNAASNAIEECGDLGVMRSYRAEELPKGVVAEEIRTCSNHPLGRERHLERASLAPKEADEREPSEMGWSPNNSNGLETLEQRACEHDAPYGCSDGYCWKVCGGAGEWCWTAANGGLGDWLTCSQWNDCGQHTYFCGRGFCDDCGCSC